MAKTDPEASAVATSPADEPSAQALIDQQAPDASLPNAEQEVEETSVEAPPEQQFTVRRNPDFEGDPIAVAVPGLADSGVSLDDAGRLVLSGDDAVTVPAHVARNLDDLPFAVVEAVRD